MEGKLKTPADQRLLRVCPPYLNRDDEPHYVILFFPVPDDQKVTHDEYRRIRGRFLQACVLVTKLKYPLAKHIVGIANESGIYNKGSSEDLMYFDCSIWNQELESQAKKDQTDFQILISPIEARYKVREYPEVEYKTEKNPRNKLCPCGSGKKWKKCGYLESQEHKNNEALL